MSEHINLPTENDPPNNTSGPNKRIPKSNAARGKRIFLKFLLPFFVLIIALIVWMYEPALHELITGTSTPTQLPPSPTVTLTVTPTNTPIPRPTTEPSATPMPASAYQKGLLELDPKIPGLALDAVVLNDDTNVTVDPPFDQLPWYSSEEISKQIGYDIVEPYYATTGPGTVIWNMDVPLQPGLYEIYILDTVYSSAGGLDFSVMLGDQKLTPLLGNLHVEYNSISDTPAQLTDQWDYLGLFDLESATDVLSILTTWEARDLSTVVAIDRVLIARQPDSIRSYLSLLPTDMPKYVVDDESAEIDSSATWFSRNDLPAWGDNLQFVINPLYDSQITWSIPCRVAAGNYDILIWAPEMDGEAELEYNILVNGQQSQGTLIVDTQNLPEDQWISLGNWKVSSEDSNYVKLELTLKIPRGATGEFGVDAVAFVLKQ